MGNWDSVDLTERGLEKVVQVCLAIPHFRQSLSEKDIGHVMPR